MSSNALQAPGGGHRTSPGRYVKIPRRNAMSTESFLQALDIRASIDTCMIRFARPTGREAENNLKSLLEGVTIVDESEGMISLKINPNKVYA